MAVKNKAFFICKIEVRNASKKHVGTLNVHGWIARNKDGETEPDIAYEAVYYRTGDILPLLENVNGGDEVLQTIYRHAREYVRGNYDSQTLEKRTDPDPEEIADAVRAEGGNTTGGCTGPLRIDIPGIRN